MKTPYKTFKENFMKRLCLPLLAFFVIGFSASAQSKDMNRNIPEWVLNLPVNEGTIYGIGQAKLVDSKDALMLAEEKAVLSAVYMASYLTYEMIQEHSSQMEQDNLSFEFIEAKRSIVLNWEVADIEIIKREQTLDGTWWCLAIYKKSQDEQME
jgi:hypothetical protein